MSPTLGSYVVEPDKQIDLMSVHGVAEEHQKGNKSPCSKRSSFSSQQSSVDVSGGMTFGFGLGYSSNAE
jgi:hypothetical protein